MKNKLKDINTAQNVYIIDKETKLKNVIISNKDPYDELFSSIKDEIWYFDTSDF
jgi:hypothetical protein